MSGLLIKDLPSALHGRLKEEARRHHRSMTKQALAILEAGLAATPSRSIRDVTPFPCRIRIDNAWIKRAKGLGRS